MLALLFFLSAISWAQPKDSDFENIIKSTVQIDSKEYGGTGFFVVKGEKQYLITAGHVCKDIKGLAYASSYFVYPVEVKTVSISKYWDLCAMQLVDRTMAYTVKLSQFNRENCGGMAGHFGFAELKAPRLALGRFCGNVQFVEAIPGESGGPVFNSNAEVIGVTIERWDFYGSKITHFVDVDALREFIGELP